MEHGFDLIQDLAVVMVTAGLTTLLFHKMKQPVVLGYMLAGLLVGPHTPPFPLVKSEASIRTLADIGIVFLMFRMGLHFSLRKLFRMGAAALLAAVFEISLMLALGYQLGRFFGWTPTDSAFLGAMLSISSTTIVVKSLTDLRMITRPWVDLIFAVLIGEDLVAITLLAVLPAVANSGSVPLQEVMQILAQLAVFLSMVLVVGLMVVPRILKHVAHYRDDEMLLVTVLGLCFGVSLLAVRMGYSIALGAFLIGAIMAETRQAGRIEHIIAPLRDMFSAVFFVAVGMLIQPDLLWEHAGSILLISAVVIFGKILACSTGTFLAGNDVATSLHVGMGLAQIGEFSFIIAQMGLSLGLINKFLYSIIVSVSAVTAFTTPYLIRNSDRLASNIHARAPIWFNNILELYQETLAKLSAQNTAGSHPRRLFRKLGLQITLNLLLITGVFVTAAWAQRYFETFKHFEEEWIEQAFFWVLAMMFSLPLVLGSFRKVQKAAHIMSAQMHHEVGNSDQASLPARFTQSLLILFGLSIFALWILILSLTIMPHWETVLLLIVLTTLVSLKMWRPFLDIYRRGQASLHETLTADVSGADHSPDFQSGVLSHAEMDRITITANSPAAGSLVRELHLRSRAGVTIVGIEREGGGVLNPGPDDEILVGDVLLLLGDKDKLQHARELLHPVA